MIQGLRVSALYSTTRHSVWRLEQTGPGSKLQSCFLGPKWGLQTHTFLEKKRLEADLIKFYSGCVCIHLIIFLRESLDIIRTSIHPAPTNHSCGVPLYVPSADVIGADSRFRQSHQLLLILSSFLVTAKTTSDVHQSFSQ